MAATSYGAIKEQFTNVIDRTDLNDQRDYFFEKAHKEINRILRIPLMEVKTEYVVDETWGGMIIPAGFLEAKYMTSGGYSMEFLPYGKFIELEDAYGSGDPLYYTRDLNTFRLLPTPEVGATITLTYYQEQVFPAGDAEINNLMLLDSDLYLYLALYNAEIYISDEASSPRSTVYYEEAMKIFNQLTTQRDMEKASVSQTRITNSNRPPRRRTRRDNGIGGR